MSSGQARADWRAGCLNAGRYDLLVGEYVDPLTVYLPGQQPFVAGAPTVWGFFQAVHAALLAQGLDRIEARVVAQDMPRGDRRRVWTDWWGKAADGAAVLVMQTVCYSRDNAGGALTEVLEFTRLDLPMMAAA